MLSIRALEAADADQVLALNTAARPSVAALDPAELLRLIGLSGEHRVAVENERVLGYALAFRHDVDYDGEEFAVFRTKFAEPFLYIDQVVTRTGARRRGLGRKLYAALERSALRHGAAVLCCEVNTRPANPGSLAFHARLGFLEQGTLRTVDGRDVVLLAKAIAAGSAMGPVRAEGG